jgi:hypothetical protein
MQQLGQMHLERVQYQGVIIIFSYGLSPACDGNSYYKTLSLT